MKELVKRAEREGEQSVRALGTLLDESSTREWLAFQLLDTLENVPPDVEQKCVGIIESISNDPLRNADAVGARQWLEAWKRR